MRETDITIDAVNAILYGKSTHIREKLADEGDESLHILFPCTAQGIIPVLARLEPCAIVVDGKLPEEIKNLRDVASRFHNCILLLLSPTKIVIFPNITKLGGYGNTFPTS